MIRKIVSMILAMMLSVSLAMGVSASWEGSPQEIFLIDDADLLTESQETDLTRKLADASAAYDAQFIIVTVPDAGGWDVATFTDLVYDTVGFGFGEHKDGVMLLICMDPREYQILSNGYVGMAIGYGEIDELCEIMDACLPSGRYAAAFDAFVEYCETCLRRETRGSSFRAGRALAVSLVIGLVVGLIVVLIMRGKLRSVRRQYRAHDYVRPGSMQIDTSYDIFLYRTVTRRRNSDSSSSSGGRSSGGSSRSRGGGSF